MKAKPDIYAAPDAEAMSSRRIGQIGEIIAARYLRDNGYTIIGANFNTRMGEIDIIAQKHDCLIFIEVKTRAENTKVQPKEVVTPEKQMKIIQTALVYIKRFKYTGRLRFDVIEVIRGKSNWRYDATLNHIENAFDAGKYFVGV